MMVPRISVLEQALAVEPYQAMRVIRKMERHPIEDYSQPMLVQMVHEVHQVLRRAVAAGGREKAGRLVAPRTVKRMFRQGQQLDVREAQLAGVRRQLRRQLPVGQPATAFFRQAHPRAEMNLVDRNGPGAPAMLASFFQPLAIAPVVVQVPHYRGRARRQFGVKRKRVSFLHHLAGRSAQPELVIGSAQDGGHKRFPYARIAGAP